MDKTMCIILCIVSFIIGAYFMYVYIKRVIKNKISSISQGYIDEVSDNKDAINSMLCYGGGYKNYDILDSRGGIPENFNIKGYSYTISSFLSVLCENVGMMNCFPQEDFPLPEGYELRKVLQLPGERTVYGVILYDNTSNTLFLVWSGTSDLKMIEEDVNALPVTMPGTSLRDNIHVHRGFLNAYERVNGYFNLFTLLQGYIGDSDNTTLVITGNSLGGGLTYISAYDLIEIPPTETDFAPLKCSVVIYTFGSPRAGNINFANKFSSTDQLSGFYNSVISNIRIFNTEDLIPYVPPPAPKVHFTHVGDPIPFTYNSGKVVGNHIPCYYDNLPR